MPNLKDIKRRIKSVKNTKKITYAMKLVSAAKLKKAQDAVTASREYTNALARLLEELSQEQGASDFTHPLLEPKAQVKKIRLLVVGGSRGLCGGYNSNINKKIAHAHHELSEKTPGVVIEAVALGKKVGEYFRRTKLPCVKSYEDLPDSANDWPIEEICQALEQQYQSGDIDEVYLIYTRFKSAMSQTVEFQRVLPMQPQITDSGKSEVLEEAPTAGGATLFEPSAAAVYRAIVPRILRTKVRQAGLEAKASEFGSRMVAMDSATSNAGELVDKLTLQHNKLRQGAITAELLDIIGGANAAEGK